MLERAPDDFRDYDRVGIADGTDRCASPTPQPDQNGPVLGRVTLNTVIVSIQHEDSGGQVPECAWSAHI